VRGSALTIPTTSNRSAIHSADDLMSNGLGAQGEG
jgi:hypothetical protein